MHLEHAQATDNTTVSAVQNEDEEKFIAQGTLLRPHTYTHILATHSHAHARTHLPPQTTPSRKLSNLWLVVTHRVAAYCAVLQLTRG